MNLIRSLKKYTSFGRKHEGYSGAVEAFEDSEYEDFDEFRESLLDEDSRPRSRHEKFQDIRGDHSAHEVRNPGLSV